MARVVFGQPRRRRPKSKPAVLDFPLALAALSQELGIEPPVREHRFMAPERQFRLDHSWPRLKVAVEYEGGTWIGAPGHAWAAQIERDCEKHTLAQVYGWIVVRATAKSVEEGRAIKLLERALRLRIGESGPRETARQA